MNIWDFITQEEIDDLPLDNDAAFTLFVRHSQRKLDDLIRSTSGLSEQSDYETMKDAKRSFMNIIVAAAKRYNIQGLSGIQIPKLVQYNDTIYDDFKADLDHYLTQIVLGSGIRGRKETVSIPDRTKDRLRAHIQSIRECIGQSSLDEHKRKKLFDRLDEFEEELNKKRTSIWAVTLLVLDIMSYPGSVWATVTITHELINRLLASVGEAKSIEEEQGLLPTSIITASLSPPRKEVPTPAQTADLDEIPF